VIGFFSLKMDRMYAVISIQLDNKYPEKQSVTGISMIIRYKNQEPLILAMKMGMRLRGWRRDFDGLRMFAVSGRDDIYYV
jgi:hypothetical protein